MFLGYQGDKIKFYVETKLNNLMYNIDRWEETEDEYVLDGDEYVLNDENYQQKKAQEREQGFYKEFFNTSLGWIRRKPTLADGTQDDFLNNDLPLFAIAMMSSQTPVLPIAYQLPDFTQELTKEYMETLQIYNQPITQQFIAECLLVKQNDFKKTNQ